ncbi:hypothetical protein LCGC14_0145820 [marine sediment metagenome]|uniref:Uncharacterized protein n=1 Tax=marine sediment metagenome TaxID=412755 RepID=A0A0F9XHC2_9ZZZZ
MSDRRQLRIKAALSTYNRIEADSVSELHPILWFNPKTAVFHYGISMKKTPEVGKTFKGKTIAEAIHKSVQGRADLNNKKVACPNCATKGKLYIGVGEERVYKTKNKTRNIVRLNTKTLKWSCIKCGG